MNLIKLKIFERKASLSLSIPSQMKMQSLDVNFLVKISRSAVDVRLRIVVDIKSIKFLELLFEKVSVSRAFSKASEKAFESPFKSTKDTHFSGNRRLSFIAVCLKKTEVPLPLLSDRSKSFIFDNWLSP